MKNLIGKYRKAAILVIALSASLGAAAQPLAANAGANTSMCAGSPITIGGSPSASFGTPPYTYSWSPSTGLSSATVANPTANPTVTTTYTLTVTDAVAATAGAAIIVNVNPVPVASSSPSSQTICSNSSTALVLNSSVGGTSFSWTVSQSGVTGASNAGGSAISQFLTNTGSTPGTVTYTVTPTSGAGCVGSPISVVATVNPAPAMTSSGTATICSGSAVNIPLSSNIPATYTWSATDNANTTGESTSTQSTSTLNNTITSTAPSTTNVNYTVQATSLAGCPGSFYPITVTVNSLPVINSTPGSQTICSGSSTNYTFGSSIAGTSYSFSVSQSGVTGGFNSGGAISQTLNTTGVSPGTATYTITGTAAGCSSAPITAVTTVNPNPTVSVNSSTICAGNSATLTATPSIAGGAYSWAPGGSTSSSIVVSPGSSTTYTCTYTKSGCSGMGFGNVTVNNPPAATFSYSGSPYCHNAVNPTPTFSGGGSAGTFTSTAGLVINSSTGQVNVLSSTPGTYTVTNTIAASGGCSAVSANSNITIVPLPNITVNSLSICSGGNDTLTAAGASTYSWSPSAGLSSATGSSPIASPSSTTSYTVTGTLNGCTSTAIATVTVNPLPTVNGGPDQSACAGSPVSFSAASNGTSYLWAFGDGVNSSALSPSHTYSAAGAYTATLTATSAAGCSLTDNVTITVNPLPAVFSTSNDVSCFGMCNGSVTATSPGSTFLWIPGNQTTAGISGLCAGVYSVVVTNANGCNAYDTVSITEPAALAVNPTSSPASCFGTSSGSATASPTGGTPLYTYLWSPSGQTTATASALAAGSHTITITDASGCTANSAVVITQPSDVTVTASLPDTICTGSNTMLTSVASGGTPPYVTYTWNDGSSNFSSAPATTVSPAVNTYYTISIIDANGCAGTNNTTVTVYPPANIYGHVTYSGGSLGTGTNAVVLYDHLSVLTTFDTVMTTTLDAGGNYYFASVPPGDYLVKVFNDTAAYPLASPTYYGDEFLWDSASVINHDCSSNFVANIVMVEASLLSGPGHVDGQVTEGDGFGRAPGDPIPGVDIKLGRNPGGQMIASTETDASGNYSFDNIPLNIAGENYVIYADIPGLERVSIYNFVVDGSITQYYDMDYEADSSTVYTTQTSVGVNIIKSNQVQFKIYPNPSTGNISISAVLEKNAKVRVEVYNVLGEMVIAPFSCDRQKGEFLQNIETDLQPGVYFVSLAIDNSTSLQRLIITR